MQPTMQPVEVNVGGWGGGVELQRRSCFTGQTLCIVDLTQMGP